MMDPDDFDAFLDTIIDEARAEEAAFIAKVSPGDVVSFSEWVWERGITGNPEDPETSEHTRFTGVVASVRRKGSEIISLSIDPASVTPKVRQQPRLTMAPSWYRAV